MKILQATTARGWSGGTEQALLLAFYMNKLGHETDILALPGTELEKRAKKLNIRVRYFPNTKKFSLREARRLARIIEEYDVVNTHISKAHWFVWSAVPFAKRKPVIVYSRRVPYPVSTVSLLTKYNLWTDGIIAVSPEIENLLKRKPFVGKKVRFIPSGVELNRFSPSIKSKVRNELGIPEGKLLIVNVGNFSEVKGHHVLIPAFKKLLDFKVDANLLLVGRDTESREAQELIEKFGLKGKIYTLGFRRDVPEILKTADLFVFPSLNEGIAGSLLQAMAMEKVVVASYTGGIKSYLKDGINGIAVRPGDVESLFKGIMRGIENLHNEKMKKEARKTAERFDINRVAKETINFYEELLE